MTHIVETHVNINPKYIKDGVPVSICNPGSAFFGMTGVITNMINANGPYINVLLDEKHRKKHNLKKQTIPFTKRELCVVEDVPENE